MAHEEPKAEIEKAVAFWRVSSRKCLTNRGFYVDYVSNERWGRLELVAEDLTREEAEALVEAHNQSLVKTWSSRASEALSWLADVEPELIKSAIAKFNLEAHE